MNKDFWIKVFNIFVITFACISVGISVWTWLPFTDDKPLWHPAFFGCLMLLFYIKKVE